MMEHVRVRGGRMMMMMVVMATGHHTRHGTVKQHKHKHIKSFISILKSNLRSRFKSRFKVSNCLPKFLRGTHVQMIFAENLKLIYT